MAEESLKLKETLSGWGNYKIKENCIYLYDNIFLQDKKLIAILRDHKIKIQLDLFT